MAEVYILYSPSLDKYYTGSSVETFARAAQHRSGFYPGAYTSKAKDWVVYFFVADLEYSQARKIEAHIKKMKSRKYIENLRLFPEIAEKLVMRFS